MADNGDVIHPQEFLILGAEHPVPVPFAVPVVGGYPPLSLVGMSALCPSPQQFVEDVVNVGKGFAGADRLMIICPARICWFSFSIRTSCFQALPRPRMVSDRADFRAFNAFLDGLTMSFPLNFRNVQPSISKPSSIWVMTVFSSDNSRPLVCRKSRMTSLASSAISFVAAVTIKSSAYRTRLTLLLLWTNALTSPLTLKSKWFAQDLLHPIQCHIARIGAK